MIGTLDIEIYEKAGVGFAQAKYLVHGFEDLFWTDDVEASKNWFLYISIETSTMKCT